MTGEADRFFGRQEQIEALGLRLDEVPLIAVAGASGCGKSSLVLAGLLSKLARDRLSGGSVEWRPAVLRPGNHPIGNLAAELVKVLDMVAADDENRVASLEGRLRLGGRGLAEIARLARLEPDVRVLVVVDQFEEIFRFKRMIDSEEAAAFVKLLLIAAQRTRFTGQRGAHAAFGHSRPLRRFPRLTGSHQSEPVSRAEAHAGPA
jgi:hypothetical protein